MESFTTYRFVSIKFMANFSKWIDSAIRVQIILYYGVFRYYNLLYTTFFTYIPYCRVQLKKHKYVTQLVQ